MNTPTLIPITDADRAVRLDEEAIVGLFAEGGIDVEVVTTCGDASCPDCFPPAHIRAA